MCLGVSKPRQKLTRASRIGKLTKLRQSHYYIALNSGLAKTSIYSNFSTQGQKGIYCLDILNSYHNVSRLKVRHEFQSAGLSMLAALLKHCVWKWAVQWYSQSGRSSQAVFSWLPIHILHSQHSHDLNLQLNSSISCLMECAKRESAERKHHADQNNSCIPRLHSVLSYSSAKQLATKLSF